MARVTARKLLVGGALLSAVGVAMHVVGRVDSERVEPTPYDEAAGALSTSSSASRPSGLTPTSPDHRFAPPVAPVGNNLGIGHGLLPTTPPASSASFGLLAPPAPEVPFQRSGLETVPIDPGPSGAPPVPGPAKEGFDLQETGEPPMPGQPAMDTKQINAPPIAPEADGSPLMATPSRDVMPILTSKETLLPSFSEH